MITTQDVHNAIGRGDIVEYHKDNNVWINIQHQLEDIEYFVEHETLRITKNEYSFISTYKQMGIACFDCDSTNFEGVGVFATGKPLEHYTPEPNELLKNRWMNCPDCGCNQGS